MGRIVVTEFVSLDGVAEDPGGVGHFKPAGWSFEIDRGTRAKNSHSTRRALSQALLLGRRLFRDPGDRKRLQLVDAKVVGDGVVILIYAAGHDSSDRTADQPAGAGRWKETRPGSLRQSSQHDRDVARLKVGEDGFNTNRETVEHA